MSDKPLRVAVIGTGHWAADVQIPGLQRAGAQVVAVCGRSDDRRREVAARYAIPHGFADWREMIAAADADAVAIATPNYLHAEMSIAAAGRGWHICCEKPLATTLADAEAAWRAARRLVTMVGFTHRFVPAAQFLKELIDGGELGEVRHIFAHVLQGGLVDPARPVKWRLQRAQAGGGALYDLGSHLLDLALWLAGPVTRLCGHLKTFIAERPTDEGGSAAVDVDDAGAAMAEFAGGATGTFTTSRYVIGSTSTFGTQGVTVAGSKATAMYDPGRLHAVVLATREHNYREVAAPARLCLPSEDLRGELPLAMMGRFVSGAQRGQPVQPDFADGLRAQALMEAWERSHAAGAWVEVAPMPRA